MSGSGDKGALRRSVVISVYWPGKSPPSCLGLGTLLSLGYFDTLFIIMCGLYPCAMTEETASLVSVNTVHAETQQPRDLINKQGLCKEGDNCYCCIEGNEKTDSFSYTCLMAV